MLMIRLQRVGRIHEPSFRVVLTDSKNGPKSGRFNEVLGSYDAREGKGNNKLDAEKIRYWISKGAQLSGTVHNMLVEQKIISGKKINVLPKKTVAKKEEVAPEKAPAKEEAAKAPEAPVEVVPEEPKA
jgi:small subunit ribosomal protein S16